LSRGKIFVDAWSLLARRARDAILTRIPHVPGGRDETPRPAPRHRFPSRPNLRRVGGRANARDDGKVAIVSGYDSQDSATPVVLNAQYLDPRPPGGFATGASATGEVRGYHNVALLLPDGRVFIAGGRTASETSTEDEKPNFRYLYPPYMSPRESPPSRPAITSAPAIVHYGQNFSVEFAGGPIGEAVLMGLGSMTHSFDTNQRYVQLAMSAASASPAQITAPPNTQTAPPGYYMLFVLDQNRVPSVASIVQLLP
jgi:hypothetical protein